MISYQHNNNKKNLHSRLPTSNKPKQISALKKSSQIKERKKGEIFDTPDTISELNNYIKPVCSPLLLVFIMTMSDTGNQYWYWCDHLSLYAVYMWCYLYLCSMERVRCQRPYVVETSQNEILARLWLLIIDAHCGKPSTIVILALCFTGPGLVLLGAPTSNWGSCKKKTIYIYNFSYCDH